MKKVISPSSILIEKTAVNFAAEFYDIGRKQGLTSKYKTQKHYAMANFEKFVPHAVVHLRELLLKDSTPDEMRMLIFDAFQERINDPEANALAQSSADHSLPDIDIAKLIPVQELPNVIKDQRAVKDYGILGITGGKKR